jgi:hypothetical protein
MGRVSFLLFNYSLLRTENPGLKFAPLKAIKGNFISYTSNLPSFWTSEAKWNSTQRSKPP